MGISLTARRKVHGAHVGYTVLIHSSRLQDESQQTKIKAITIFSRKIGRYSILKEMTAKLESSTSVEYQKGVLNTASHSSIILLKVSKKYFFRDYFVAARVM